MKRSLLILLVFLSVYDLTAQIDSISKTTTAKVYFLRRTGYFGSFVKINSFIDGQLVCRLSNNSYSIHELTSGKHYFTVQLHGKTSNKKAEKFEITIESGKTYYLEMRLEQGAFENILYCQEATENNGKNMIKRLQIQSDCK